MKITICGSISFMSQMRKTKQDLLKMGVKEVFLPRNFRNLTPSKTPEESGLRKIKYDLINAHYKRIIKSDCILVLNCDKDGQENYIGGNTFLELGFAFVNKKPIYLINPIPEAKYRSEILGMRPKIINGDLTKIKL